MREIIFRGKRCDNGEWVNGSLLNPWLSFNKISKILNLDWGCVKQRYEDYVHDNPELLEGENNG